jgi:hypothetical protein
MPVQRAHIVLARAVTDADLTHRVRTPPAGPLANTQLPGMSSHPL